MAEVIHALAAIVARLEQERAVQDQERSEEHVETSR